MKDVIMGEFCLAMKDKPKAIKKYMDRTGANLNEATKAIEKAQVKYRSLPAKIKKLDEIFRRCGIKTKWLLTEE